MCSLLLDAVSFTYEGRSKPAVQDISLEFALDERVTIEGLNGSGKSTLARLMMGLLKPQRGSITLKGKPLESFSLPEIGSILGFLLQNPSLMLFNLSVFNEVAFGLKWKGKTREEIERTCRKYLDYFGIWKLRNELPFNLSQGEKQLVALCSILALGPSCLILDEPTKNIDQLRKEKLKSLLLGILSKGTGLIVITHDKSFAKGLYDRRIKMVGGRIVSDGS